MGEHVFGSLELCYTRSGPDGRVEWDLDGGRFTTGVTMISIPGVILTRTYEDGWSLSEPLRVPSHTRWMAHQASMWPKLVPFPRLQAVEDRLREVRGRVRSAWSTLRHGEDPYRW